MNRQNQSKLDSLRNLRDINTITRGRLTTYMLPMHLGKYYKLTHNADNHNIRCYELTVTDIFPAKNRFDFWKGALIHLYFNSKNQIELLNKDSKIKTVIVGPDRYLTLLFTPKYYNELLKLSSVASRIELIKSNKIPKQVFIDLTKDKHNAALKELLKVKVDASNINHDDVELQDLVDYNEHKINSLPKNRKFKDKPYEGKNITMGDQRRVDFQQSKVIVRPYDLSLNVKPKLRSSIKIGAPSKLRALPSGNTKGKSRYGVDGNGYGDLDQPAVKSSFKKSINYNSQTAPLIRNKNVMYGSRFDAYDDIQSKVLPMSKKSINKFNRSNKNNGSNY